MRKYIIKRLLQLIPILFGITLLTFVLMHTSSVDAVDMMEQNTGMAWTEAVSYTHLDVYKRQGYIREYDVERMMRDAKITEIYEGTSEVQRMVISGALLK